MRLLITSFVIAVSSSALWADTPTAKPLSYEDFEAAVPHVDLETCPAILIPTEGDVFCRATLANDDIHVFVFAADGDSPMVDFASFSAESLPAILQ